MIFKGKQRAKDCECQQQLYCRFKLNNHSNPDFSSGLIRDLLLQGEALDQFAKKTVQVMVVGNPANTNALICSKYAPSIPRENFSAMTRLDQNRAQAQIAAKFNVPVDKVSWRTQLWPFWVQQLFIRMLEVWAETAIVRLNGRFESRYLSLTLIFISFIMLRSVL